MIVLDVMKVVSWELPYSGTRGASPGRSGVTAGDFPPESTSQSLFFSAAPGAGRPVSLLFLETNDRSPRSDEA